MRLQISRWLDQQSQFELFIWYSSITIMSSILLGSDWLQHGGFYEFHLDLPQLLGRAWSKQLSHEEILAVVRLVGLFSGALMLLPKLTRRVGAVIFLGASIWLLLSMQTAGVAVSYYILLGLALTLFPTGKQKTQRGFLIGAIAASYLFAAIHKMNWFYLSGAEFRGHFASLGRSFSIPFMKDETYSRITARAGIVCELTMSLIFFVGTRLAALSFAALVMLYTMIFLHINNSHAIIKLFPGFCFLIEFTWARGWLFVFLLCWQFGYAIAQEMVHLSFTAENATTLVLALFLAYAVSYAIVFLSLMVRRGASSLPLTTAGRSARRIGAVISAVYGLAGFYLPTPLGWSQYSGQDSGETAEVVYLSGDAQSTLVKIQPAWHDKIEYLDGVTIVASHDSSFISRALSAVCNNPGPELKAASEKMAWGEFLKISTDDVSFTPHIRNVMRNSEALDCSAGRSERF